MTNELEFTVGEEHVAAHIGSGSLRVLATPVMIAFMERVSHRLLAQRLPEGFSSVGTLVEVRHLAPTPLGDSLRVRCEVLQVDGRRVTLSVQAWDSRELVGDGRHERVIIDLARFLARLEGKSDKP
jgi:predicted thioesterase